LKQPYRSNGSELDDRGLAVRRLADTYRTTLGKKAVMAVTGTVLLAFVVVHMLGNLQIFLGADAINRYGRLLRIEPALLWFARAVLLASVSVHIIAAVQLTLVNWAARPIGYAKRVYRATDYASRTMVWSGPVIAAFVVYHVLHLSVGAVHPDFVPGDVYHNVVAGFSVWYVSVFYVAAQLLLGLHLYHGAWSLFQSLGVSSPGFDAWRRRFAQAMAVAVVLGNCSVPAAVLSGLIR
jgi:succinate dehydrogenase / fumarate reductase cytochrome b subunit